MTVRSPRRLVVLSAAGTLAVAVVAVLSALVVLPADVAPPPPTAPPVLARRPAPPAPAAATTLVDDLRAPTPRWAAWRQGTPAAAEAAFTATGLRLSLATLGSRPGQVHGVGAVSSALEVGAGLSVRARLDWQAPANACYRAGGLCVVPAALVDAGDLTLDAARPAAWLEVVGVPPGRTARRFAAVRTGPHPSPVFTDGWPIDRAGRALERVTLEVVVRPGGVSFAADGEELGHAALDLGPRVRVLLYQTSHANYPARPVVFEEVAVGPALRGEALAAAPAGRRAP